MEGYFSYIVLKEKQLAEMYNDTAFLIRAHTAYRTLFWRLIESLELLSVLSQSERPSSSTQSTANQLGSPSASRIASDSRIPKSTSEPLRLSVKLEKGIHSFQVNPCIIKTKTFRQSKSINRRNIWTPKTFKNSHTCVSKSASIEIDENTLIAL
jgi:hypothetical protein